jgi:hypothetical protein
MKWKVFYGGDATYSDEDGPPQLAPKRNVQCISVEDSARGRRIEYSENYYILTDHGWRGCDKFGLFDYLIEPGFKVVLFGRSLSDEDYTAVWHRASRDPYLPPKSAYGKDERRPS